MDEPAQPLDVTWHLKYRNRPGAWPSLRALVLASMSLQTVGAAPPEGAMPDNACKMTTTFPDHATFTDACLATIVLPRPDLFVPKGSVSFLDAGNKTEIFNLNFYLPLEVKSNVAYAVTTETKDSSLRGIVQPAQAKEQCRITKSFPTSGTVTFTTVGTTGAAFHGTVQVYPSCYLNMGTPQQTLVPGGQVGGGTTLVVF